MSDTTTNVSVNRQHKDRLFTMIFGDTSNKKNILSLYNALYDTNYTNEEDVEITTIEDTLVKLPTPKYIVFYNGTNERKPIEKLRLSDAFMTKDSSNGFEWTATMINLNEGKNEELLSKCKPLSDYMTLVYKINCYKKMEKTLLDAVDRAINECIEEDVLADFLRKHRGDVMGNCLTEFDEELYKEGLLEEGLRTACVENAKNFFKNGVSYALVRASITQLTDEELQAIYKDVTGKEIKK